jgi:hypothetical protein
MPPPYQAAQIGILTGRDDRDIVSKYGRFCAPFFRLEISDKDNTILFSAESQTYEGGYDLNGLIVSEVEWDENDCAANMLRLSVNNVDLKLQDSRLFAEGNNIDLWMGYDGHVPEYMGRGIIAEIEVDFPDTGIPTLTITAYDISYFMMEEGRSQIETEGTRWWERGSTPAAVAEREEGSTVSTHIRDNQADAERARNEVAAGGGPASLVPGATIETGGPSLDPARREVRLVRLQQERQRLGQSEPTSTTALRLARLPGKKKRDGKVWREMTDSEIAAAIYESYGIIPFIEATNERARATRTTTTTDTVTAQESTHVRDTGDQASLDSQEAAQGGFPAGVVPNVNVEENAPQLDLPQREVRAVGITEQRTVEQTTGGRKVVQKAGTTDWEFLKKLAAQHGFIIFVFYFYDTGDWVGYFGPPDRVPQQIEYTFKYAQGDDSSLKNFRPRISMRGQSTEIDLLYMDPILHREQKLRVSVENVSRYSPEFLGPDASSSIAEPLGMGPEVVLTIHGMRVRTVANRRFTSVEDARRWLLAFWFMYASEFCEAEGEMIIGIPEIKARHSHVFNGFGRVDGSYFLTKVNHVMGTGSTYSTKFSAYRQIDLLFGPQQDSDQFSVESDPPGELSPETNSVLTNWRNAIGELV